MVPKVSKGQRNKGQSARERIAAQQEQTRRAEARRRMLLAGGAVGVVLVVVLGVVLYAALHKSKNNYNEFPVGGKPLPAIVHQNVSSVPTAALATVGTGSTLSYNPRPITAGSGKPLISDGKPEMLYIGAEFCPYCAAMRWSMAVALSRFGTLSPLHGIRSSSTDIYPSTATLTFYKSHYTSKYLTFTPVENERVDESLLQPTTPEQQKIWQRYEPSGTGYPFIDFGNKVAMLGPVYDPAVLHGLDWQQISAALHRPGSKVARGALGAANLITAAICRMTGNMPASVCTTPPISSLEPRL
jgi:thiol-disulfide isomerase/thioredoxin